MPDFFHRLYNFCQPESIRPQAVRFRPWGCPSLLCLPGDLSEVVGLFFQQKFCFLPIALRLKAEARMGEHFCWRIRRCGKMLMGILLRLHIMLRMDVSKGEGFSGRLVRS